MLVILNGEHICTILWIEQREAGMARNRTARVLPMRGQVCGTPVPLAGLGDDQQPSRDSYVRLGKA